MPVYLWGTDAKLSLDYARRFNDDTSLDTSFGTAGLLTLTGVNVGGCGAQADGKLLALLFDVTLPDSNLFLLRRSLGGTPDTSFGTAGSALVGNETNGADIGVPAVQVRPNGSGTICHSRFVQLNAGARQVYAYAWPADGSSDAVATFQTDGVVSPDTISDDSLLAFCVTAAGGFVIPDYASTLLLFYDAAGALVSSVNKAGTVGWVGDANSLALCGQSDGKVVYLQAGVGVSPIVNRYSSAGVLEWSTTLSGVAELGSPSALSVLAGGKIMVVGLSPDSSTLILVRLNADGSVDTAFGSSGYISGVVTVNPLTNVFISYYVPTPTGAQVEPAYIMREKRAKWRAERERRDSWMWNT